MVEPGKSYRRKAATWKEAGIKNLRAELEVLFDNKVVGDVDSCVMLCFEVCYIWEKSCYSSVSNPFLNGN